MSENTPSTVFDKAGKYLTFRLDKEEYGLVITKVVEIIGIIDCTPLPRTPDYVKGVINLRGKVIPVIDLRLKFGLPEEKYTEKSCIIVVEIYDTVGMLNIGIIVDSVSEVLNITPDDLEETPRFGVQVNTEFILGMAKGKGVVRTLLDIDKIIVSSELSEISESIA